MANARPVRVARTSARSGEHAVKLARPRVASAPRPASPRASGPIVVNRAAVQRANRLSLLYAGALLVVYGVLGLYARSAPGGTSPGANDGLLWFAGVAVAIAAVGIALTLGSAPRRFELGPERTVVIGRLGRELRLPPLSELNVRVVRRFPEGWLSSAPVEHVEISPRRKGRVRSFLVEEHLLGSTSVGRSGLTPDGSGQ